MQLEVLFGGVFTNLSGWLNGIRNIKIPQSSFYNQRIGTRACSPLIGYFKRLLSNGISFFLWIM